MLLGRGVSTNRRAGNAYFREIVSHHMEEYLTSTKTHKMEITRRVIALIHTLNPPGRFLEKDALTDSWKEVTMKRAHEKAAQALRDGAALLRSKRPVSDEVTSLDVYMSANKKCRRDSTDVSVDSSEPVKVNLPPVKEEEKEVQDVEGMNTGLYSPIFSASLCDLSLFPESFSPCPISPCPSASTRQSTSPSLSQDNRKDSFVDCTFGGLPFHIVDCNCTEGNEEEFNVPIGDMACLDDMVDIPDEEIFLLWLKF